MDREQLLEKLNGILDSGLGYYYCVDEESDGYNDSYTFANSDGVGKVKLVCGFNPLHPNIKISQHSLNKIAEYLNTYGEENLNDSLPEDELEPILQNITQDSEIEQGYPIGTIGMAIRLYQEKAKPDTYYHFYEIFEGEPVCNWEIYYSEQMLFDRLCRLCEVKIVERWEDMSEDRLEYFYNKLLESE